MTDNNEIETKSGRVYHAWQNTKGWCNSMLRSIFTSKYFWIALSIGLLLSIQSRAYLQEYVLVVREYAFSIFMIMLALIISIILAKKGAKYLWFVPITLFIGTLSFVYFGGQQYVARYLKYQNLNKVEMVKLPLSGKPMPQPLNSVHVITKEKVSETEEISVPDRIISNDNLWWSMEITPDYFWGKLGSKVRELYIVPGTTPSPDLSKRRKVCFNVGEGLIFSANSYNAAIKSFGPLKYLSYFPVDVRYLPDENGDMVQVISLAKWDGFFFPNIEFGGVIIVKENCSESFVDQVKRVLVGTGTYIAPKDIKKHSYLKQQNLVPYNVYRYMASSFRYQAGFFWPLKAHHKGDIRIPDMPDDQNEQPFIQYFSEVGNKNLSGLFASFALEPYKKDSQGLAISLLIPGDDIDTVYYYHHARKQEGLTGSTAIASKVEDKKKNYDWKANRPIENRLYIRDIAGKRRLLYLTTIVVVKENGNMAGSEPEIAITDATHNAVTFVDVRKTPEEWDAKITETNASMYSTEGGSILKTKEPISENERSESVVEKTQLPQDAAIETDKTEEVLIPAGIPQEFIPEKNESLEAPIETTSQKTK